MNNDGDYAQVTLSFGYVSHVWKTVFANSTVRNSDGTFSFQCRNADDHKIMRVTISGNYFVQYPPVQGDNK